MLENKKLLPFYSNSISPKKFKEGLLDQCKKEE
jgi:hypothetical protein